MGCRRRRERKTSQHGPAERELEGSKEEGTEVRVGVNVWSK
jgi:hypothetical protein